MLAMFIRLYSTFFMFFFCWQKQHLFKRCFYFRLGVWLNNLPQAVSPTSKSPGVRFSKVPLIYGPGNLTGTLPGDFIGPGNAFLKAPGFLPIFSGIFSGFVAWAVARASIFQPVIGVKIEDWHRCTELVSSRTHQNSKLFRWIVGKVFISSGLPSSRNVY